MGRAVLTVRIVLNDVGLRVWSGGDDTPVVAPGQISQVDLCPVLKLVTQLFNVCVPNVQPATLRVQ